MHKTKKLQSTKTNERKQSNIKNINKQKTKEVSKKKKIFLNMLGKRGHALYRTSKIKIDGEDTKRLQESTKPGSLWQHPPFTTA
jgi:hypothetical protein